MIYIFVILAVLILAFLFMVNRPVEESNVTPLPSCKDGASPYNGKCWVCPEGYEWNPEHNIDSDDACVTKCPNGYTRDSTGQCKSSQTCAGNYPSGYQQDGVTWDKAFEDGISGKCYSCPEGYDIGIGKVDSDQACTNKAGCDKFSRKGRDVPFRHLFGECYDCPIGFTKSFGLDINARDGCISRTGCEGITPPAEENGLKYVKYNQKGLTGECYACPEGYDRTLADINHIDACISTRSCRDIYDKDAREKGLTGELFEHWSSGECYACPPKMSRTIFDLYGDTACSEGVFGPYGRATYLGNKLAHARRGNDMVAKPEPIGALWHKAINRGNIYLPAIETKTTRAIHV